MSKIGRFICTVSWLLVHCSIGILGHQKSALSESAYLVAIDPGDLVCYMQTRDGRIINLNKLCINNNRSNQTVLSTTDQQFLEEYQSFLRKRAGTSPLVSIAFTKLQQSPQAVVERAQEVCATIRSGNQQNSTQQPQRNIDADLINTMAVDYYCPDLDD